MNIALDFDDTYTRDPLMWDCFIDHCHERGHDIRIVTFRYENFVNTDLERAIGDKIPVIYCNANKKRGHCASIGFFPDVWIDDTPEFITADSYVPGELLAKNIGYYDKE